MSRSAASLMKVVTNNIERPKSMLLVTTLLCIGVGPGALITSRQVVDGDEELFDGLVEEVWRFDIAGMTGTRQRDQART